jgi:uncharacterized protein YndB with AHSA1/START domain
MKYILTLFLFLLTAVFLHAEVIDSDKNGFTVKQSLTLKAPAAEVYQQITQWGEWWNGDHSYSGDAGNFYLEPWANGCWCERLPGGGSVMHLQVVYAEPGKMLRLTGGLGPLQGMAVSGVMTLALTEENGATTLTLTYSAGGYLPGGLDSLAAPVDGVIGEQVGRLGGLFPDE